MTPMLQNKLLPLYVHLQHSWGIGYILGKKKDLPTNWRRAICKCPDKWDGSPSKSV